MTNFTQVAPMSHEANNRLAEDNDFNFEQSICIRDSCDADVPVIASIYAYHVLHSTASFETEAPSSDEKPITRTRRQRNALAASAVAKERRLQDFLRCHSPELAGL
jgi:hypothetical protein